MPLNLIKKYPQLLDISSLSERDRITSLKGIFKRDIEDNNNFCFRSKIIRPIAKEGQASMETLFHHLTTRRLKDEKGKKLKERCFDIHRSQRLHWIKFHVEEKKQDKVNSQAGDARQSPPAPDGRLQCCCPCRPRRWCCCA